MIIEVKEVIQEEKREVKGRGTDMQRGKEKKNGEDSSRKFRGRNVMEVKEKRMKVWVNERRGEVISRKRW